MRNANDAAPTIASFLTILEPSRCEPDMGERVSPRTKLDLASDVRDDTTVMNAKVLLWSASKTGICASVLLLT
jgi:hypothetical protein